MTDRYKYTRYADTTINIDMAYRYMDREGLPVNLFFSVILFITMGQ